MSDNRTDRPYWCEICARKKNCYGITLKPKCFVPTADRKTDPSDSEKPNNCEKICDTCKHNGKEWYEYPCDSCCRGHSNYEPKTEPQIIRCPKCGRTDYIRDMEKDMGIKGSYYKYKCINCNTYIKDESQTERGE